MKPVHKLIVLLLTILGLAVVAIVFRWSQQPEHLSLQDMLGRAFNRPAQYIEVNLPPADGRYPGAVMLMPQLQQTLPLRRVYRPIQVPDYSTSLTTRLAKNAEAALAGQLLGNVSSAGELDIDIVLNDLRLFEVDLNEQFRQSLLNDEDVYRAEKRGHNPRVIVRTYEAIVSMNVRRTGALSAEAWRSTQDNLVKAGGRLSDAGTITIEGRQTAVIAYETVTVNYLATSLSGGRPMDIEFREAAALELVPEQLDIAAFGLNKSVSSVNYALLGNSRYDSAEFANLRVVEPSVQLVEEVFQTVGAAPLLKEPLPQVLTGTAMDKAVEDIVNAAMTQEPSLLILYYVGHAVSGQGGELYLVLQDYQGNLADDLGEDLLLGLPRAQLNAPTSPLYGSNIHDLLDVVVALQAEIPQQVKGLYPVSKLVKALDDTGRPYMVLIDGCYEHLQMDKLRQSLNLTKSGDYYGPVTTGGGAGMLSFSDSIRQFGVSPHLTSSNVVIFSSTPGTFATEVADPRPLWELNQKVAPLAQRLYSQLERVVAHAEPQSWGTFIQSIVDVKPVGELRIQGSISWSDFSEANKVPMLEANSAE